MSSFPDCFDDLNRCRRVTCIRGRRRRGAKSTAQRNTLGHHEAKRETTVPVSSWGRPVEWKGRGVQSSDCHSAPQDFTDIGPFVDPKQHQVLQVEYLHW